MSVRLSSEPNLELRRKIETDFFQKKIGPIPLFLFSIHKQLCRDFIEPYTLSGFEPGCSDPEADAIRHAAREIKTDFVAVSEDIHSFSFSPVNSFGI
jgi:hypothetical protein